MRQDIYDLTHDLEESYWWYVARRRIILAQARLILEESPPAPGRPRILDYGCGAGANLAALANLGLVHGLDISPRAVALTRSRGLTRVALTSDPGPDEPPFGGEFDLITALDVLEHVADEAGLLACLTGWLRPGGALLLAVPAYRSLWSGEDEVSHHLRRYTAPVLLARLRGAGLVVGRLTYFMTLLLPLQAAVIWGNRLLRPGSLESSDLTPLPGPLNRALTGIMSLETGLLKRFDLPLGGSLLAWGRRPGPDFASPTE